MSFTLPPTAPSRTMDSTTFSAAAEAWVAWESVNATEMNNFLATNLVNYNTTSTTSAAIATGSKSFTVDTGKLLQVGHWVIIASTASPSNYMIGQVTSYNSGTGALVVNVTAIGGSGTIAAWTISLTPVTANGSVIYANIQNVAASRLLGNPTGSGAAPSEIGLGAGLGFTGTNIQVQFAATARLHGRTTAGAGAAEEISVANGLTLTAGVLGLGAITPSSVAATGAVTSSSASAGVGYATGAGGTVTQATSKSTAVTLNTLGGQITTNNASLVTNVPVLFTVNDSSVAATDVIILNLKSGPATAGSYRFWIDSVAAGSFVIAIENRSGGPLSEALVLSFAVIKSVTS